MSFPASWKVAPWYKASQTLNGQDWLKMTQDVVLGSSLARANLAMGPDSVLGHVAAGIFLLTIAVDLHIAGNGLNALQQLRL
jgi:hypothetical protein